MKFVIFNGNFITFKKLFILIVTQCLYVLCVCVCACVCGDVCMYVCVYVFGVFVNVCLCVCVYVSLGHVQHEEIFFFILIHITTKSFSMVLNCFFFFVIYFFYNKNLNCFFNHIRRGYKRSLCVPYFIFFFLCV